MDYEALDKLIIEIMQEHYRQGFSTMQIFDIKEDIKAETGQAIERILKRGDAFKPRHDIIKLTKPPVESGGFG